jgi:hypothetical protein
LSTAGHIFDMINRIKSNNAALSGYKRKYEKFKYYKPKLKNAFSEKNQNHKELTEEEKETIRKRIRAELKAEKTRAIINTILVVFILFASTLTLVYIVWK